MVLRNLFTRQQARNGQRIDLWACGEWRRGCDVWKESHGNLHSVQFSSVVSDSCDPIDSQQEFTVWLRKLKQGLCINLEGWDGAEDGREVQKGRDIFMLRFDRKQ